MSKLKKSHQWDIYESIDVICPYCRKGTNKVYENWKEGDEIECFWCKKHFILGKQK